MRVGGVNRSVDRARLKNLIERERQTFVRDHPRSRELHERATGRLLAGVPMVWMTAWPGDYPVAFSSARGNRVVDVDDRPYIDFCLGDTGSMSGHSPKPVIEAIRECAENRGGITTMLPNDDATLVAEELSRRFGPLLWQFP